jgi:hypothetical protein
MKVHKGDTVLVIAGKDKGAKGKVLKAYPDRQRVLVEGVNAVKKHTANSAAERGASSGGIAATPLPPPSKPGAAPEPVAAPPAAAGDTAYQPGQAPTLLRPPGSKPAATPIPAA